MQFGHHDLGHQRAGTLVKVTLRGTEANVRLMDGSNFQSFRSHRRHHYIGGHYRKSPTMLSIPRSGHWHVAVDLGGLQGRVQSGIEILPGKLPAGRSLAEPALAQIGRNALSLPTAEFAEYDVFVSHASEDKDDFVRALAGALAERGLRVWYDEFTLRVGDSLRRSIDSGIANSRFGVVVLSPSFLNKGWPQYELDGLVTRQVTGEQIVLPIWHKLTRDELIRYSPSLADRVALDTAQQTLDEIAEQLATVIEDAAAA